LPVALGDRQPLRRPRPALPSLGPDDPLRRRHLPSEHHLRCRPRPALQHPRKADRLPPPGGDPGLCARLRRGRPAGEPRLLLPEPLPLHLPPRLLRAQLPAGQPGGPGGGRRRAHLDPRPEGARDLLAGGHLNGMLGTIGSQQQSLASAVAQLPDFMRQFNTTAVNLGAALDDVQPLVDYSKPVARKLQPFTKRLRHFARDAVPTIKGLNGIIDAPGQNNDLIELTRLQDPLAEIGVGPVQRNGASRPGALPASADSLKDSLNQVSML